MYTCMYIFTYLHIYIYIHTHVAGYKKVILKMLQLFSPVCARVYIYIYIYVYVYRLTQSIIAISFRVATF